MARISPLTDDELAALDDTSSVFATATGTIGFVPNSARTILRWPALSTAFRGLAAAMREAVDTLPTGLANLVHLMASNAAGCMYCQAHGAVTTIAHGVSEEKLASVWEFETSPLFDDGERAALRLAAAAAHSPSQVTDEHVGELRAFFDEDQIVRIVGVVAISGFMNRWNATVATTLEDLPREAAEERLAHGGWAVGVHG